MTGLLASGQPPYDAAKSRSLDALGMTRVRDDGQAEILPLLAGAFDLIDRCHTRSGRRRVRVYYQCISTSSEQNPGPIAASTLQVPGGGTR
jgi:hypothetical protein